jgi:hypothetical protein
VFYVVPYLVFASTVGGVRRGAESKLAEFDPTSANFTDADDFVSRHCVPERFIAEHAGSDCANANFGHANSGGATDRTGFADTSGGNFRQSHPFAGFIEQCRE